MFRRTKLKLVVLNAIVFFILQNFLGGLVYVYTRYSLYQQVDQTILEKKAHLTNDQDDIRNDELSPKREENHQLVYLFWGKNGQLYNVIPQETKAYINTSLFSHLKDKKGLQTVKFGQGSYRFVNVPVSINDRLPNVQSVQILYNLQRENEMLEHLLMVIGFGSLLSIFIALFAGIYLANKALVPIKSAWDKQQQFVADASHELRTPLSVSKLNLEYLFRHPTSTIEEESETIHQVIQEINYISKMSSDLLTLARSDTNQIEIFKEPLNLDDILNEVVKLIRTLAVLKDIHVQTQIFPIKMVGDKERLKQLFIILLDNALKYTKENGTVSIKASIKNTRAIIEIVDTGIGISEEDLPYIFDRYFRGDKSRTRHLEGTGLGLSIAQWITHAHGGKIQITSREGEGTHVIVSFPLKEKR